MILPYKFGQLSSQGGRSPGGGFLNLPTRPVVISFSKPINIPLVRSVANIRIKSFYSLNKASYTSSLTSSHYVPIQTQVISPIPLKNRHLKGCCREYFQVNIKGVDKKIIKKKPGTHKEIPKPDSTNIAKEIAKLPLTYASTLKNPYNIQNRKLLGKGGGRSRYCGRGRKGFERRHSIKTPICMDYAGGNPPFETYKTPKFGNIEKKLESKGHIAGISLPTLKKYIDANLVDPTKKITYKTFVDAKIIPSQSIGIRLIPQGFHLFEHKIDIEVSSSCHSVIARIEALGGKITVIPADKDLFEYYFNPEAFFFEPPLTLPSNAKDMEYYSSLKNRGFLSKHIGSYESFEECVAKLKDLHKVRAKQLEDILLSLPKGYPIPEPCK